MFWSEHSNVEYWTTYIGFSIAPQHFDGVLANGFLFAPLVAHTTWLASHRMALTRERKNPSRIAPEIEISSNFSWSVPRLAQMKYGCPRTLQAERNFSRFKPTLDVISGQYIDKPVIYCQFPARSLQPLNDWWKFQDNFANTAGADSKISQKLFQRYAKDDLNALLQLRRLLTLQNHCSKHLPFMIAFCQYHVRY